MSRTTSERVSRLRDDLADERGGRVVLLSHCLLNQNVRYLGGAACPGVVAAAVSPYLADGTGIVQMPCPEQRVWGGVPKRRFLWLIDHPRFARAAARAAPALLRHLRRRYRALARQVVDDVQDYRRSGMDVVGVVGVAGSPSCGVTTTLDLRTSLRALGRPHGRRVSAAWLNREAVAPALRPGTGLYLAALLEEMTRRDLAVPVLEHTLAPVVPDPRSGGQPGSA